MRATTSSRSGRVRRDAGFTMIELSVAMVIALFLLAGLFTIQQSTRKASTQQTALAQLQDNERLAMTIMTDVIQSAGYFADPSNYTITTALPSAVAPPLAGGQGIYGPTPAAGQPDSIYVQYMSEGPHTDNLILCNGQPTPDTKPVGVAYINQFKLDTTVNPANLVCVASKNVAGTITALTAQPVLLVEGVTNLQVLYGVATSGANGNSVDTYVTAAQINGGGVAGATWPNVSSVKVTLTFTNPLYGQAGYKNAAQKTVTFERVIGVMGRMGGS